MGRCAEALPMLLVLILALLLPCSDGFTLSTTSTVVVSTDNSFQLHMTKPENENETERRRNENLDDGEQQPSSFDDFLDQPYFDPDTIDDNDPSPIGKFAKLVKEDYELAETLFVGSYFVILIIITQELLRYTLYGDQYTPFLSGGSVGAGKLF